MKRTSTWHAAGGMHTFNGEANISRLQKYTIDLYREIMMALPATTRRADYLAACASAASERPLAALFDGLRGVPFRVEVAEISGFLHVGSTREVLASLVGGAGGADSFGMSAVSVPCAPRSQDGAGEAVVLESRVDALRVEAGRAFVDRKATEEWSKRSTWKGMQVLQTQQGGPDDYVIATGKMHSVREFAEFEYQTKTSWSRLRRVIGKAEVMSAGDNPRFIVTNLPADGFEADADRARFTTTRLYEEFYCARGEMENVLKQQVLDLAADTHSTHFPESNQLRLWLASFAYLLLERLRAWGCKLNLLIKESRRAKGLFRHQLLLIIMG